LTACWLVVFFGPPYCIVGWRGAAKIAKYVEKGLWGEPLSKTS
jgi:hypothetical protein